MTTRIATTLALLRVAAAAIDFSPCPEINDEIATELNITTGIPTFDCASISVPLDYTDDSSEDLELNLFRVEASEEPVLGNVLINFGGPGGTGAQNLPAYARAMQEIIGRQWNLLSWDPRGTGKTIPFQCTPPTGLANTTNTKRDLGSLVSTNLTKGFLDFGWDFAGQIADACYEQANETGTLIGTAFVARDVMQIVDALDDGNLLHYYGWSYGTALGSYIAAMFPDQVGRMVLDGNVNPHDYQSGTYLHNFADIDEAFDGFLEACFEAEAACSLYSLVQPNSTQDLLTAINGGLRPLSLLANAGVTTWLSWLAIKNAAVQPLYFPTLWPQLADTITALLSTGTPPIPPVANSTYDESESAVIGIRGSDATFQANSTEEYLPIIEQAAEVSKSFSDVAYTSLWASARWRMPAKERYWGDFRATTNTPILYVNGQYDPVTPLIGAYNGSAGFEGSVVLEHSGYGHGLLASPSECAQRYIRQYFRNASLPENGTVCEPDFTPLGLWEATVLGSNATTSDNSSSSSSGTNSSSSDSDSESQQTADNSPDETSSGSAPSQTDSGAPKVPGAFAATIASACMLVLMTFFSL